MKKSRDTKRSVLEDIRNEIRQMSLDVEALRIEMREGFAGVRCELRGFRKESTCPCLVESDIRLTTALADLAEAVCDLRVVVRAQS
jgi:hypothetical protein